MLKKIIPSFVKRLIQNSSVKVRYGVKLKAGSHVHKSKFEEYCLVGKYSAVIMSDVGRSSYIGNNCNIRRVKIGRYCSIGSDISICLGNHPTEKIASIHPCFYSLNGQSTPSYIKNQIFEEHKYIDSDRKYVVQIGNDVWIGNRVSIMDGVKVGDGAVLATYAVITKDVEAYSIVGGIPAKHIRYRFTEEQRKLLEEMKWWDNSEEWVKKNAYHFADIDGFIKNYLEEAID